MNNLGVLAKSHNCKVAIAFGVATLVITVILRYAVDAILPQFQPKSLESEPVYGINA